MHDKPGSVFTDKGGQQDAILKVAQYPSFLRLTNLEIHAGRLFAFLIC